jgi:hypothetical protein
MDNAMVSMSTKRDPLAAFKIGAGAVSLIFVWGFAVAAALVPQRVRIRRFRSRRPW